MFAEFINSLKLELEKTLPGIEAQKKMSPSFRFPPDFKVSEQNPKPSSVMIIFYPDNGKIKNIFIKRKEDGKAHSGQVAFPGGKFENSDINLKITAIRETFEEIGVEVPNENIIGNLTPLYIPVSNYEVTPFISFIEKQPIYKLSHDEVEKIITVDTNVLFHNDNKGEKLIARNNFEILAPYYRANGDIVWGATAMILSELNEIICKNDFTKFFCK